MDVEEASHGRYTNPVFLARGSFGVVVKSNGVAIKKLERPTGPAHETACEYSMRERELAALRECASDHVCRHIESFESKGNLYIVMELYTITLQEFTDREWPMTILQGVRMLRELVTGVDHIHRCGYMHRDLKPTNIFLAQDGRLIVGDFGLSRRVPAAEESPMSGHVQTRWYRSPEIAAGLTYTIAADVWSIGCILFECMLCPILKRQSRALFRANSNFPHSPLLKYTNYADGELIEEIFCVIGSPSMEELAFMRALGPDTPKTRKCFAYIDSLPHYDQIPFAFPPDVSDLAMWLYSCVAYLPARVSSAILLEWILSYRC